MEVRSTRSINAIPALTIRSVLNLLLSNLLCKFHCKYSVCFLATVNIQVCDRCLLACLLACSLACFLACLLAFYMIILKFLKNSMPKLSIICVERKYDHNSDIEKQ